MPVLTLLPIGKKIEIKTGTKVLEAIRESGVEIPSPCNGQHLCGKCKVKIAPPPPMTHLSKHLTEEEIKSGVRLACEASMREDIAVTLPSDYSVDIRVLEGEVIKKGPNLPAAGIQKLKGRHWLRYHDQPPNLLKEWKSEWSPAGVAVDLGTTTMVTTLMDLGSGTELATVSSINPQIRFGHDVMTRIKQASTEKGLAKLSGVVAEGLNELISKTSKKSGIRSSQIIDAVIGGNTTMLQIAAGIDPSSLGAAPFAVGIQGGSIHLATRFGLHLNSQARAYIPPISHAFVGADLSAGLLAIDAFNDRPPLVFIDIGTNGEMAIVTRKGLFVSSTAAGPAFEGMGIQCGMSASPGAIERVWTNGTFLSLRTIADAPPKGICGSGIMEIMSSLIDMGIVEPSGRLKNPRKEKAEWGPFVDRFEIIDGMTAIRLTENIYFTQRDIRQFQLAKSAIQTGLNMLLAAAGINPRDLQKIVIAGAFGYHLNKGSLKTIGIIPADFMGEVHFAGNTCRTGCVRMLMDRAARDFLQEQMKKVKHLSIAESLGFQAEFFKNMTFAQ